MHEVEGIDREFAPLADKSCFQQSEKVRRTVWPREALLAHQALRDRGGMARRGSARTASACANYAAIEARRTGALCRLQAVSIELPLVQPGLATGRGLGRHGAAGLFPCRAVCEGKLAAVK